MKHLKTYENIHNTPKVGDYAMVDSSKFDELESFFNSEIGQITSISEPELKVNGYPYFVTFKKTIPSSSFGFSKEKIMTFKEKELLAWSNDIKDIEIIIQANKYNL